MYRRLFAALLGWVLLGTAATARADAGEDPREPVRTAAGAPYAPAVAGTVLSETRTPQTGAYRLAYRAGRGVTEIRVPSRPGGWRLTLAGPATTSSPALPAGRAATARVHARPGVRVTVTVVPRRPGPARRIPAGDAQPSMSSAVP
ncbi:hypothetical protein [Streptomyces sp. NPDC093094]|uniref:hypothetical protein n=1 Tax=Streptomyces sp. NPDC093094 TaxID=3366026 RepID=UPI00380A112C